MRPFSGYILALAVVGALIFMIGACSGAHRSASPSAARSDEPAPQTAPLMTDRASFLNCQIHDMAVQILQYLRNDAATKTPIAVATFVDLNDLHQTSPFGRFLAKQLIRELQRAGLCLVEIRKAKSILIRERFGEYALSRNIKEIAEQLLLSKFSFCA